MLTYTARNTSSSMFLWHFENASKIEPYSDPEHSLPHGSCETIITREGNIADHLGTRPGEKTVGQVTRGSDSEIQQP